MNLADKISNAELEIMKILWREQTMVPFSDIRAELQKEKGWEKSTINTLIRRLVEKGVISVEKHGVMQYAPNISEAEYKMAEERNLINKLYNGNAKNLVAALCHRGELTEADIDELKTYFKMGRESR